MYQQFFDTWSSGTLATTPEAFGTRQSARQQDFVVPAVLSLMYRSRIVYLTIMAFASSKYRNESCYYRVSYQKTSVTINDSLTAQCKNQIY
jgi:hypothetical protein